MLTVIAKQPAFHKMDKTYVPSFKKQSHESADMVRVSEEKNTSHEILKFE